MTKTISYLSVALFSFLFAACGTSQKTDEVKPVIVTEQVLTDSDDPAIWINPENPAQSLVLGTDKDNENGGIYVFNLDGKIDHNRTVLGLKRPDNVDIEYGFQYGNKEIDIAVCTERGRNCIRVFSLPDMKAIDNGGIPVFVGDSGKQREPMGIALYKNEKNDVYAIVGRKSGKDGEYLWQYKLSADTNGIVSGTKVRALGKFSGKKEIESIVVDDALGYVYYSDETFGVRQYYASPDSSNTELSTFAQTNVAADHEGLSVYPTSETNGYILLSDQGANRFHIYTREDEHKLVKIVNVAARESDGSDVTAVPLNDTFKHGLFVVMSTDKTFHFYRWEDVAQKIEKK